MNLQRNLQKGTLKIMQMNKLTLALLFFTLLSSCYSKKSEEKTVEDSEQNKIRKLDSFQSPNLEIIKKYIEKRPDSVKYARKYGADIIKLNLPSFYDTTLLVLSERFYVDEKYIVEHDSTYILISAEYNDLEKYLGMRGISPNYAAIDSLCDINYKHYPHKESPSPRVYFEAYQLIDNSFQPLDSGFLTAEW